MAIFCFFSPLFGWVSSNPGGGGSVGFVSEKKYSEMYQRGDWDGSPRGTPTAEVIDGLFYFGGKLSDYPADSSKNYYRPVIVSVAKGTWFLYNPSDGLLVISCDKRGENLFEVNFSPELRGCTEKTITVTPDKSEITVRFVYVSGTIKTFHIATDYTLM